MKKEGLSRKGIHYGYVIVGCCCLMMGVDVGLVMSCAGIFYQPVSKALGVSVGDFGVYMSLSFIFSSLALTFAGRMMERYSARWLLTINSAICGIALAAMGLYNSLWQFYITGAVIGITLAFLLYLSFPTLINRWFNTRVGLLIGICSAASGIGGVIFNPIGGIIITMWGWRWGYIVFGGIILLVVTPLLAWLLRDFPEQKGLTRYGEAPALSGGISSQGIKYTEAVRMPVFYGMILFAFLMMATSTLNLFIPKYVMVSGFTLEESAYAASAIMAGVTIGKLLLGYVNDRNCTLGSLATTGCGIAGLLLLIFESTHLWVIICGAFLFGWAYAGVTVQTAMLVRTIFGSAHYAHIYSVISVALAAGGAISSALWGFIAEATGYAVIFITGITMLIICTAIALVAIRNHNKRAALTA